MELRKGKLEEVFGRPFKDDGTNYVALCPLHNERTPSFCVHKENAIYHCFGCKEKGRLIKLVEEYKGVDEREALKLLGLTFEEILDIEFNAVVPPKPNVYPKSWLAPFERKAHKYVLGRGLTIKTIGEAEGLYDHHSKRQVFPHRRGDGKLVGAIGRACAQQEPKWWFYWGYNKGRYLYRAPTPATNRVHEDVWIVEGVFDALWLYQHGYNAVATLGSKPTEWQLAEIKDLSNTLILAYDCDHAGIEGTRYLYDRLHTHKTCLLPEWPKWGIDVMDTNPTELELHNVVQWQFISPSDRSSRVLSQ